MSVGSKGSRSDATIEELAGSSILSDGSGNINVSSELRIKGIGRSKEANEDTS